ncbi:MAG: polysaccharide-degrading enzyme, partial [Deltaproteobacteria bacterium]|nr:polysaccharide-degrading enzyme [Deltaproteobacteria bacterium]
LKDRSVGTVIRYNWIEGGNRNLDLVDAEDDPTLTSDPRYRSTFVYGNVFIKLEGGNNQVIHYGGDSGDTDIYRKGTLHLFNNTLVSTRSGNTTLLRLSTNEERADVRNNVLYVAAGGASLAMVDETGVVDLRNNWSKPGWVDCHGALQGTINDLGGAVTGASPGFVDEVAQDYRLASGAACIDRGAALHAAVLPAHALGWQYVPHQSGELRPMSGSLDLGAFEHCPGGSCIGLADAGFASVDGAASSEDATAPADASPSARDGTAPSPDADEEALDASTVMGADASPATAGPDAATAPDLAGVTSSCGCSASEAGPTAGLWAGWMALLWSVRLRALRR